MNKNWIDFKELRSRLRFPDLLQEYGIKLSPKGEQLVGFCPLPNHNGNRNSASFSVHPEKGIFQCFGCGGKGNILDFAVLMEKGDPKRGLDVRKTALKLNKLVGGGPAEIADSDGAKEDPPAVNEPLTFRLSDLNHGHEYLKARGFTLETMQHFGVGYCLKGIFAGRIAIPLYDTTEKLIGYAGRVIDDSKISPDNPKYLFPGKRETDGEVVEFKKSRFLYNGCRFKEPLHDLVIVEGFASVWWLAQCGFPQCVAIMGASASSEQIELILHLMNPSGRIWIFQDGDDAGNRCADELLPVLARHRLCRVVGAPKRQPTDFSPEEIKNILGT